MKKFLELCGKVGSKGQDIGLNNYVRCPKCGKLLKRKSKESLILRIHGTKV